ncbi:MAG: plasmid pRiA4b ORF-3 family protein [Burkholderiales bacterium]|nr:plasmid pRiA4b ORF-3 family protein [Burkholderiales bacterium]
MATKRGKAAPAIFQLHIELRGSKPKIWRRVLVPETITLLRLHLVIQAAFGWGHSHMHEFIAGDGERYGTLDPDYDDPGSVSSEKTKLCPRRPNFDHPCRLNNDQGRKAALSAAVCG